MIEKLMPRSDEFFDDFDQQAATTVEGARLFKALLDDFTDVARKVQAIKDVEEKADAITHQAFERLHKQFITPFDRGQMRRLLSRIDDVLDLADAASERLLMYEITDSTPDSRALADVLVRSCETMQEAVRGLRLIKKPEVILAACREINALEHQADTLLRATLAKLFKSGGDPLTIMKWKEIYDLIETATDRCEDVADVIEGVVLEHS